MVFTPAITSLARSGPSNATVVFELQQMEQNPEFFEVSYYYADGTSVLDQVYNVYGLHKTCSIKCIIYNGVLLSSTSNRQPPILLLIF